MRLESPTCPNCGSKDIDPSLRCQACECQLVWSDDAVLRVVGLSVVCLRCHHANESSHRFCARCGAELAFLCPVCRTSHPHGTLFCPLTGKEICKYEARAQVRVDSPKPRRRPKSDVLKLIERVSSEEDRLRSTQFLAPCVAGGSLQARVEGLVYTFRPSPPEFEGWGIFRPVSDKAAELVEEAALPQVLEYLRLMVPLRVRLVARLTPGGETGQTWLAYPSNESDAAQRLGEARPAPVHLVAEGVQFEQVLARWDGRALWFEEIDRRAEPAVVDHLREALRQQTGPEEVRFRGCTPEMRTVYGIVHKAAQNALRREARQHERRRRRTQEERLASALRAGGGDLTGFVDHGSYWTVHWRTSDGETHTSAISLDFSVISAGICLSGQDARFDLQSLVGVVEQR